MKILKIVFALVLIGLHIPVKAQEFKEVITKELTFAPGSDNNTLIIHNVLGSINVEGYEGNTIKIEVEKIIKAPDSEQLALGKKEINIKVVEKPQEIYVFLDSPYSHFNEQSGHFNYGHFSEGNKFDFNRTSPGLPDTNSNTSHSVDKQKHQDKPADIYDYLLNYKVKVPFKTSLTLTNKANGDIKIQHMEGRKIAVDHMVGSINLQNITSQTTARTISGDITATYKKNPDQPSTYNTAKGNIHISYRNNLAADLKFENYNGNIYSDFITKELAKQQVIKEKKGAAYQIQPGQTLRMGGGGPTFKFASAVGNITIQKL